MQWVSCKYSVCGAFWCRCSRTHVTTAGTTLFWQSTHDVDCWHCFHHCLWENVGTETLTLLLVVKFLMYPRKSNCRFGSGTGTISIVKVLCIRAIHLPCGGNRVNFWKWLFSCVEECWDVWSAQETKSRSVPTVDSNRQTDGTNADNGQPVVSLCWKSKNAGLLFSTTLHPLVTMRIGYHQIWEDDMNPLLSVITLASVGCHSTTVNLQIWGAACPPSYQW